MPGFRRRTSRSSRGARIKTTWEQIDEDFLQLPGPSKTLIDVSHTTITNELNSGGMSMRLIGKLQYEHAAGAQAIEGTEIAAGICVMTKDSFTSGVSPSPLNGDEEQDWYWWNSAMHSLGPAGTDGGLITWPIEIKSKRRLRGGYRLVFIASKGLTELGLDVHLSMRVLWSLNP